VNYYPHHIGDYLRDTVHLTMIEDGAYRRMLDLYYASEKPLPLDLSWLCRLMRAERDEEKLGQQPGAKLPIPIPIPIPESRSAQRSQGSRLPADWRPSEILEAWAFKERPDLDIAIVVEKFRDYWTAKPGRAGAKLDWGATFRNWVRDEKAGRKSQQQSGEVI
jgi:hypothetical protein